jgi:hypothetical protein
MGGSRREQVAYRLMMAAPDEMGYNSGIPKLEGKGPGSSYRFAISLRRNMDGEVRVYGERFIMVDTTGPISDGKRVFESEQAAADYIRLRFKEFKAAEALDVPTKPAPARMS